MSGESLWPDDPWYDPRGDPVSRMVEIRLGDQDVTEGDQLTLDVRRDCDREYLRRVICHGVPALRVCLVPARAGPVSEILRGAWLRITPHPGMCRATLRRLGQDGGSV
jgi:hypothetical protein